MTNKHTSGPWTWGQDYNGLYGPSDGQRVLEFDDYEGMHLPDYTAEGPANARLIAAAPDLLDACRLLLSSAHDYQTGIAEAEAAIAKAEGGVND